MQVLLSTGSLSWYSLPQRFAIARAAGVDGLELLLTPRLARRGVERVRELEEEYGLPVRTVHSILRVQLRSAEQMAADIVESALLAASFDGCSALVIHPPPAPHAQTREARQWFDAVARALEIAEGASFQLALENLSRSRPGQRPTAFDQLEYVLRVVGEWDLRFTLDTAHAASFGWDLVATASAMLPRLANVHLSDAVERDFYLSLANSLLRDHRLPGRGSLPLAPLLRLLEQRHYAGFVTLELSPLAFGVPRPSRVIEQLRDAITFCRHIGQATAGGVPPGSSQRSRESG
ncbi:sugar phosphate isomerase/epimerase [Thermomicrobiaceae bacterium CFH 74404]|uniref:Sugar phosphate isomerase/epimerase n=1 Tax=Thermalbibacter longus TaxID=2951981 RepID=A0AA41WEE9_9BACT|nr:sugar phosphate isomerase/epimerase [Thermalbibacter longus]MCM8750547.1 sugar phosphate isomerase/epimerase [Thermalbibacter longus]